MDYKRQEPYERYQLGLPFVGIPSFGKFPICTDLEQLDAHIAVLGIPYDLSIQYRTGTRLGPRGIRTESMLYAFGSGGYDFERDDVFLGPQCKIVDCGDVDMIHGDLEQCFENAEIAVRKIVEKGAIPVIMGGDHAVTIPVVRALDCYDKIHILHIDSHLDWADARSGQRYGNGSPMRRVSELPYVDKMVQIGIHGIGSSRKCDFDDAKAYGSKLISPRQLRKMGIDEALSYLPEGEKYYITIDIDGLDASVAPGAGTPNPGGLTFDEVDEIVEKACKRGEVIGYDFVEVAPPYDPTGVTGMTAAKLMLNFMGYVLKKKGM